jgi:membrane-associated phospholipid phosphatase
MTHYERLIKNLLFFFLIFYNGVVYTLINDYTSTRSHLYTLTLPGEEAIPFSPLFVWAYILNYGFVILHYLIMDDLPYFKRSVWAFFTCTNIHFAVFLLFPVEYIFRPSIDPYASLSHLALHFYYWVDQPFNCFPSLHVSTTVLIAFILNRYRPALQWLVFGGASLVAIAVIIVKQHYILDAFIGIIIGYIIYRIFFSNMPKAQKK